MFVILVDGGGQEKWSVDGALSSSGSKMALNWTTPMINLFIMLMKL
jgi:hypothetical protein